MRRCVVRRREWSCPTSKGSSRKPRFSTPITFKRLAGGLGSYRQGLEVTRNVSLDEVDKVKKNLDAWVKASEKEYINLRDNKAAFKVVT